MEDTFDCSKISDSGQQHRSSWRRSLSLWRSTAFLFLSEFPCDDDDEVVDYSLQFKHLADAFNPKRPTLSKVIHHHTSKSIIHIEYIHFLDFYIW